MLKFLITELDLTICGDGTLHHHVPLITPTVLYLPSNFWLQVLSNAYFLALIFLDSYLSLSNDAGEVKLLQTKIARDSK